jgi:hypothetical protein
VSPSSSLSSSSTSSVSSSSTEPENLSKKQFQLLRVWSGKLPKDFGAKYREIASEQDEAVSTASVEWLIKGINSGLTATKDKKVRDEIKDVVTTWLVRVSGARLATKFVGRATANASDLFQHPTSVGIFAPGTVNHETLDLERRNYVQRETQAALGRDGATIESVFRAMIRAAGEFTLNVMAAPATASTVTPHTFNTDRDTQHEQTQAREEFKRYIMGWGDGEPGGVAFTQLDTAPWRPSGRDRGLSPARQRPAASSLSTSSLSSSSSSSVSSFSSSSSSASSSSSSLLSTPSVSLDLTSPPLARNSDLKSTSMPDAIL